VSEDDSLTRARERLAARVIKNARITDPAIAAALRDVPRHLFLPHLAPESAYVDDAIVTKRDAGGQPISSSSQPAIMAIMLDQLNLSPGQRVLEIGAGTGYNAALMKHIVGPQGAVVSVDIDPDLVAQARDHLAAAGYPDVTVVAADGAEGYRQAAPYDRVIATVGVSDLAPAWLEQAGPGGRIVVPFDVRGTQVAAAFERAASEPAASEPAASEPAASERAAFEPAEGGGHWVSVSLVPCGFMRMRGSLAGPERTLLVEPGFSVMLPDGLTLADGHPADAGALAAFLAEPSVTLPTGVRTGATQVIWGIGLWLAAGDARSCAVTQERLPGSGGRRRPSAGPGQRAGGSPLASSTPAASRCSPRPPGLPSDRRPGPGRLSPGGSCCRWPGSARTPPRWPPISPRTWSPGTPRDSLRWPACTSTRTRGQARRSQTQTVRRSSSSGRAPASRCTTRNMLKRDEQQWRPPGN
jgi:protein-L-isoaspartate(D-aspartate) O-methyltransferase